MSKSKARDPQYIDKIEAYLESLPRTDRYSFKMVGDQIGFDRRTVGNAMRELGKRGRADLCAMVVYAFEL